jgi:hypothetical protein
MDESVYGLHTRPDDDGVGGWVLVGLLLGLEAVPLGLMMQSPAVLCAGPAVVAAVLLLLLRWRAASVGALLPLLCLVALGLASR